MILKLVNNLTKVEYELEVTDKGTSGSYYDFDIVIPSVIGKALCAGPPKPSAVDPRGPKFTDPLSTI